MRYITTKYRSVFHLPYSFHLNFKRVKTIIDSNAAAAGTADGGADAAKKADSDNGGKQVIN